MIDGINETTQVVIGVCTAGVLISGAFRFLWLGKRRPGMRHRDPGVVKAILRDARAARDSLLGREAIIDSITGEERSPALPGIGMRMAHQETQMSEMTRAVTQLAETHTQMAEVRSEVRDLGGRVAKLEEAAVERVVTKAESAAAWRAMEAAALATPDPEPDDD